MKHMENDEYLILFKHHFPCRSPVGVYTSASDKMDSTMHLSTKRRHMSQGIGGDISML